MASLSQGTIVQIGAATVLATRVTINKGDYNQGGPRVTVSHLGSDPDKEEPYELTWASPSDGGPGPRNVQIDYMGDAIAPGGTANLQITGPIAFNATCTVVSSSTSVQTGDVIRSSVTLKLPTPG